MKLERNRSFRRWRLHGRQSGGGVAGVKRKAAIAAIASVLYVLLHLEYSRHEQQPVGSGTLLQDPLGGFHVKSHDSIDQPATNERFRITTKSTFVNSTSILIPAAGDDEHSIGFMPSCRGKSDLGKQPPMRALEAMVHPLGKLGATYWVTAGTLLGFARNCSHIHYDIDVAVSLDWADRPEKQMLLVETILQTDKRFAHNRFFSGIDGTPFSEGGEMNFQFDGNIKVDVFLSLRTPNLFRNGYSTVQGLFSCPRPMRGIQKFQWGALEVPIPMPYQDVLIATYGEDYMTPKKHKYRRDALLWKGTSVGCLMIRQGKARRLARLGVVACLSDAKSQAYALALAHHLKQWESNITLQLYHHESLAFMEAFRARLGGFPNVLVIALFGKENVSPATTDPSSTCHAAALAATRLEHVLLVRPSIVFFRNPQHWLYTIQYIHDNSKDCAGKCGSDDTCVTATDSKMVVQLQQRRRGICRVKVHPVSTTPRLLHNGVPVAEMQSSVHGSINWVYPNENYGQLALSDPSFEMQETPSGDVKQLAEEYLPFLKSHWKAYRDALGVKG